MTDRNRDTARRAIASDAINKVLSKYTESGDLKIVAAMVCDSVGELYGGAVGDISSDDNGISRPMALDSVGAIMSMTKALTGTAAMQLVERGLLDLDAPAGDVCPYLAQVQVLTGYDEAGNPQLRAPRTPVTLRNLLTHSSGFVYDIWNGEFRTYSSRTKIPSLGTGLKAALEVPLMFDPGARWEYGIGIDWAGQMVEAISGQTLGQYCEQHIFKPLMMFDTGFKPTEAMLTRMTKILHRNAEGKLVVPPVVASKAGPPAEFEAGGGGLLSTVQDYSRFLRMILGFGELDDVRVLESETVKLMAQNQMGDLRVVPLKSSVSHLSSDAEFFAGEEKSWGLTFQISETACATGRQAGTLMWAGLANSFFWIDHQSDLAGVFLTQVLPFGDAPSLEAFYEFESEAYNQFA